MFSPQLVFHLNLAVNGLYPASEQGVANLSTISTPHAVHDKLC